MAKPSSSTPDLDSLSARTGLPETSDAESATPVPQPAPKPGLPFAATNKGVPAEVVAAMGGAPLVPPPVGAGKFRRADTGGLLAPPSPHAREVSRQIEQARNGLGKLVADIEKTSAGVLPILTKVEAHPDIAAKENFDTAKARELLADLRAVLDKHFPKA